MLRHDADPAEDEWEVFLPLAELPVDSAWCVW